MAGAIIRFPWYLLVHADDETPLVVSADDFDLLAVFTDPEFARLYAQRSTSEWVILEISRPEIMVDFFEQLIEASSDAEGRPLTHACFDPIEPTGDLHTTAFAIDGLLAALRKSIE